MFWDECIISQQLYQLISMKIQEKARKWLAAATSHDIKVMWGKITLKNKNEKDVQRNRTASKEESIVLDETKADHSHLLLHSAANWW